MDDLGQLGRLAAVALLVGLAVVCFVRGMRRGLPRSRRIGNLTAGVGVLVASGALLVDHIALNSQSSWVYAAPDDSYRLMLPSRAWQQAPVDEGGAAAAFVCRQPQMQVQVFVKPRQAKADFARAVEIFRGAVESDPRRRERTRLREGVNAAGHPYVLSTALETTADGESVLVAHALVWNAERQLVVEVVFEGVLSSHSGQDAAGERQAVEQAGEGICLGVE